MQHMYRVGAHVLDQSGQHGAIRVVDMFVATWLAWADQLVARGKYANLERWVDAYFGVALGCQHGNLRSTHQCAFCTKLFAGLRSEEHTSELQSLMRISYAVFCLKKKNRVINKYSIYIG